MIDAKEVGWGTLEKTSPHRAYPVMQKYGDERKLLFRPVAVSKQRRGSRSAGFQPAVSPISNRQNVAMTAAPGLSGHPQAGSTAIQQVGNLRYGDDHFVHPLEAAASCIDAAAMTSLNVAPC